jgi:hypothetical protein
MSINVTVDFNEYLAKMNELNTTFTNIVQAMNKCSEEFHKAAAVFQQAATAVPAFERPPPIDTATPAAAKAAEALAFANAEAPAPAPVYEETTFYKSQMARLEEVNAMRSDVYSVWETRHLRQKYRDYNAGCVRTIDGKRILIYKFHAFQMPADRRWNAPGPLVSIGSIYPETKEIEKNAAPPTIPTGANWPWAY